MDGWMDGWSSIMQPYFRHWWYFINSADNGAFHPSVHNAEQKLFAFKFDNGPKYRVCRLNIQHFALFHSIHWNVTILTETISGADSVKSIIHKHNNMLYFITEKPRPIIPVYVISSSMGNANDTLKRKCCLFDEIFLHWLHRKLSKHRRFSAEVNVIRKFYYLVGLESVN